MKRTTLVFVPDDAQSTKTISYPQFLPKLLTAGALVSLYALVFFAIDYVDLRLLAERHRELVEEHEGIKSETLVLSGKLDEVRQALEVVRNYTSQLEALTQINAKKIKSRTGIGPLTHEEFKFAQSQRPLDSTEVPVGINIDDLTFSPVLKQLTDIHNRARQSTFEMQLLLSKLDKKRSLLSSIPSLSPVNGWITSGFGYRISPFTGERSAHRGIDIASSTGTPIIAPADGVVIFSGRKEDFGNFIMIAHGYGVVTRYGHNAHNLVQPGQKVKRGDQIGTVGASGRTTGPHLHYEVWVNGRATNPKNFILGLGEQHIF